MEEATFEEAGMIGRVIRIAAIAGAGMLAWRWWQGKQAEDREYSLSDPPAGRRPDSMAGASSPMGARVDETPAQ